MRLKSILVLLAILLGLGGYYYMSIQPKPPPPQKPQLFVWLVEIDDLKHIAIELPRQNKSQAFSKHADRYWYFDAPPGSMVNLERWGGGIPLLLSGPATSRVISENSSEEKLTEFGLSQPRMNLTLTLENEQVIDIKVGDSTPDGANFYVQAPGSNDVALVDYSWFQVIERLVTDPPYPAS